MSVYSTCWEISWYDMLLSVPIAGNAVVTDPDQGLNASVTVRSGDVFSGIFFGASIENQDISYLLKMVQQTKAADKTDTTNGVKDTSMDYIGVGEDHSMSFEGKDVLNVAVDGVIFSAQEKQQNGMEKRS